MTSRESTAAADAAAPARRALLLINPNARRGDADAAHIAARLEAGGLTVIPERVAGPDDLAAGIRRRAAQVDCVVVSGGDGTMNSAAAGLLDTGLPMGILPTGTANDLARTLGIPADIGAAVEVILAGHTRRIDLGTVNGLPFFNVASIGISAELARSLDGDTKRRFGRLGYAVAALRVLARSRRFSAWVTENGGKMRTRTLQIAVGNGRFYGGGTVVEETAAIDDARLDLYSLELRNVWKLALMLRTFRSGAHGAWSEVRTARGSEFEIRTSRPRPVNADGELITETPALFRVHPEAITVYTPAEGGPGTRRA